MRLGESGKVRSRPASVAPRERAEARAALPSSRALIATTPAAPLRTPTLNCRQAPFLAQLIATRDRLPQTRERRCTEPSEAIAAYRRILALVNAQ
jgi:hypothetical protein